MGCYCQNNSDSELEEDDIKSQYRECTDVMCNVIFALLLVPVVSIAMFAYSHGDARKLVSKADSFGNVCGSEDNTKLNEFHLSGWNLKRKKYHFSMDYFLKFLNYDNNSAMITNLDALNICVEKCPDRDLQTVKDVQSFFHETGSSLCRYDLNVDYANDTSLFSPIGPCPVLPILKSTAVLNECVPEQIMTFHLASYQWNLITEIFRDIYKNQQWIIVFLSFSFFLAVIIIPIIYNLTKALVLGILTTVGIFFFGCTALSWWTYCDIQSQLDAVQERILDDQINNEEAFIWISCIITIFTLIVFALLFTLRRYVHFLLTVFKEASKCLSELIGLCFIPIFSFILLLLFYSFWISVVVRLPTASQTRTKNVSLFTMNNNNTLESMRYNISNWQSYVQVEYDEICSAKYLTIFYTIWLLWITQIILDLQHMLISSTVAQWYFPKDPSTNGNYIIVKTFRSIIFYHTGSLILGSILIMLFKLPRIILTFVDKTLKKNENHEWNWAEYSSVGCSSCLCCYEKFLRFLNHNTYPLIASRSYNFFPAAYRAWKIKSSNKMKLRAVNNAVDFFLFLIKCLISSIMAALAICVFRFETKTHLYASSACTVFLFCYFTTSIVISLYESIIDTLFLCFYYDHRKDSTDGRWKSSGLATISYRCGYRPCTSNLPIELQRTSLHLETASIDH